MATRKPAARKRNAPLNADVLEFGRASYDQLTGWADEERDDDGFVILKPSASRVDAINASLTTDISSLEEKLKQFKAKKAETEQYKKTDEYKESKKKQSKKKIKKKKANLLEMVFNSADIPDPDDGDEEEEDDKDGTYRDSKKRTSRKPANTLATAYGQRFAPVVSMLHDAITEFDQIADDIREDLEKNSKNAKSMYKTSQIGNLISAKNSKLSAVKELASVAKLVSDIEYKKEKDKKAAEGSDTSKQLSQLGAKFLRGGFDPFDDDDDDRSSKKGNKKDKGSKGSSKKKLRYKYDDDEDDDDETGTIARSRGGDDEQSQREMAKSLAAALGKNKDKISFTPHERYIAMEGKYTLIVACDLDDPDNTWKFIAVDPKSGKEIKGFKDDYGDLLPKKKNCRMTFDLGRLKAIDRNSGRTYKMVLK